MYWFLEFQFWLPCFVLIRNIYKKHQVASKLPNGFVKVVWPDDRFVFDRIKSFYSTSLNDLLTFLQCVILIIVIIIIIVNNNIQGGNNNNLYLFSFRYFFLVKLSYWIIVLFPRINIFQAQSTAGGLHLVFINSVMRQSSAVSLMSSGYTRAVWCFKLKNEMSQILLPPGAHDTSKPV